MAPPLPSDGLVGGSQFLLWTLRGTPLGFPGVSEKLGFFPTWLKRVELRHSDSLQGSLVPGHPSTEAGPGGLGLPRDPAGVPRAAELHRARQAQGEAAGPPEYGKGPATPGGRVRLALPV